VSIGDWWRSGIDVRAGSQSVVMRELVKQTDQRVCVIALDIAKVRIADHNT
jgi:hypothetical protein